MLSVRLDGRGASLVELVVSMALVGIVAAAVHGVMLDSQRLNRRQVEWVQANSTLRLAAALVSLELAGLDAGDTASSDLIAMAPHRVTYEALRSTMFLCRAPQPIGAGAWRLMVGAEPRFGTRLPDPERDSILIWAEADPGTADDDHWTRADLVDVRGSSDCPDRARGYQLTVRGVRTPNDLVLMGRGVPVLGLQVTELRSYSDRYGDWWLGLRRLRKSAGWSSTQPVLGPLAPGGVRFSYFDAAGFETAQAAAVARIEIGVAARGGSGWGQPDSTLPGDSLSLLVALRNNPRSERREPR